MTPTRPDPARAGAQPEAPGRVHVIGASGRSGAALCRALGARATPVVRDPARWAATGIAGAARVADLGAPAALARALADATTIVSCAHARHAPAILRAAPPGARLVLLGSTRKFTRWPDAHGQGVLAGERAFLDSGRAGVMLHPTMIYGAEGEDNVRRLAALLARLPVAPLPGAGRALVQPIYQGDVTRALLAAAGRAWDGPHSLVIAGPSPMRYAHFAAAVARAAGLRPRPVVPLPAALLRLAARLPRLPLLPRIGPDEIRRLLENKDFDIGPMVSYLGVTPIPLERGLALTFAPLPSPAPEPRSCP